MAGSRRRESMDAEYDRKGDVLYLHCGTPCPAVSEDVKLNCLLRRDIDTGLIVGLTVVGFARQLVKEGGHEDRQH